MRCAGPGCPRHDKFPLPRCDARRRFVPIVSFGSNLSVPGRGCEGLESLRVFGRLPVIGARACTEAGVRKASREETAGEFAPAVVSDYGDLAPAFALMFRVRAGKDG